MAASSPLRAPLTQLGCLLVLLGPVLAIGLKNLAEILVSSTLRGILFVAADVFRLLFFAGVILLLLGLLRALRARRGGNPPSA